MIAQKTVDSNKTGILGDPHGIVTPIGSWSTWFFQKTTQLGDAKLYFANIR
ncbi:MAG: hypothetical protein R3C01_03440 [Planctomycetaceae bacterium]